VGDLKVCATLDSTVLIDCGLDYVNDFQPSMHHRSTEAGFAIAYFPRLDKAYLLRISPQPLKSRKPELASGTGDLLQMLRSEGVTPLAIRQFVEEDLLAFLICPSRGLVISGSADTCLFSASLADPMFWELAESDSTIGREAGVTLLGGRQTPNLFEAWEALYAYDCGAPDEPFIEPQDSLESTWEVWNRETGLIETFRLRFLSNNGVEMTLESEQNR
jgi:hypothetical protein